MQYLSPSTLLGGSIPTPFDNQAIRLGRKKLLAELELTGGDSIDINGVRLTKGNIIDYFEDLQRENVIDYHNAVEEDIVLKDFLEVHAIERGFQFKDNPLYHKISFIQWISPYFLSAFIDATDICFRTTDDGQFSAILDNLLLMTDYDLEQAWGSITRILSNNISMLEYYRDNGEKGTFEDETLGTASHLMSFGHITLILLLPERRFSEVRNKYAFVMEQAAIFTFNKKISHRAEAEIWIENALQLAVAPELKTELQEKQIEMKRISDGKKTGPWGIARFAWLLIFVLAKAFTCNESNNTYNTSKIPFILQLNDSTHVINGDTVRIHPNSPRISLAPSISRDSYLKHQSDTPGRFNYRDLRHSIDSMSYTR